MLLVNDKEPSEDDFDETPGCQVTGSFQNPTECFSLFFTEEVWQFIVDNTNEYAAQKMVARGDVSSLTTTQSADYLCTLNFRIFQDPCTGTGSQ